MMDVDALRADSRGRLTTSSGALLQPPVNAMPPVSEVQAPERGTLTRGASTRNFGEKPPLWGAD